MNVRDKIAMLDLMMEKLFVISSDGNFHLKVENDATPISDLIESRRMALSTDSGNVTGEEFDRAKIEAKCLEIQANKEEILH